MDRTDSGADTALKTRVHEFIYNFHQGSEYIQGVGWDGGSKAPRDEGKGIHTSPSAISCPHFLRSHTLLFCHSHFRLLRSSSHCRTQGSRNKVHKLVLVRFLYTETSINTSHKYTATKNLIKMGLHKLRLFNSSAMRRSRPQIVAKETGLISSRKWQSEQVCGPKAGAQ